MAWLPYTVFNLKNSQRLHQFESAQMAIEPTVISCLIQKQSSQMKQHFVELEIKYFVCFETLRLVAFEARIRVSVEKTTSVIAAASELLMHGLNQV